MISKCEWHDYAGYLQHDKACINYQKQHTPEFCQEALKLAERTGVTAAAHELNLYESQLYNWRSKQRNQHSSSGDIH